jgi:1,2-diacylglycerol 3-alpha-glucosyltransferase
MRILLVSDVYLPTVSGVATSTDSIARYMAKQGHTVTLVCPKPLDAFTAPKTAGLTILYTPGVVDTLVVNKSMTVFPLGFGVLWQAFRTQNFDIVHIQEPGSLGVTALFLAKWFRVPTVGAQHFSWSQIQKLAPIGIRFISVPFMKLYVRVLYSLYDAIMVPTRTAKEELERIMGKKRQIYPVSNGVDTTIYVPRRTSLASLRKKYDIPGNLPVFLYIGRLDRDKNIETILRASAIAAVPHHLIIAGVGKQREALIALASALKITNLTWIGEVQKRMIIDMYQLADVFVIMSPVETQSIVALQAIACGLPIIVANKGALPELVNGKNGRVVDTYDVKALASVMDEFAADRALRVRMGKASRMLSMKHHKPSVLSTLETLYRTLAHAS